MRFRENVKVGTVPAALAIAIYHFQNRELWRESTVMMPGNPKGLSAHPRNARLA
jgi:hypothetical protein